jgi:hypothetical protein
MKSAEQILKEALVGRTLVKTAYGDEVFNKEIVGLDVEVGGSGEDAMLYLYLKYEEGSENDETPSTATAYMNEGLELK